MFGSCFQAQNPTPYKTAKINPPVTIELMAFHMASPKVALKRNHRRSTPMMVRGRLSAGYPRHAFPLLHQNSQARKLAAPIAMPSPKTIPASAFLLPPSPKANIKPPTTMAIRLKPSRYRAGERLLQHVDGLEPGACTLGE